MSAEADGGAQIHCGRRVVLSSPHHSPRLAPPLPTPLLRARPPKGRHASLLTTPRAPKDAELQPAATCPSLSPPPSLVSPLPTTLHNPTAFVPLDCLLPLEMEYLNIFKRRKVSDELDDDKRTHKAPRLLPRNDRSQPQPSSPDLIDSNDLGSASHSSAHDQANVPDTVKLQADLEILRTQLRAADVQASTYQETNVALALRALQAERRLEETNRAATSSRARAEKAEQKSERQKALIANMTERVEKAEQLARDAKAEAEREVAEADDKARAADAAATARVQTAEAALRDALAHAQLATTQAENRAKSAETARTDAEQRAADAERDRERAEKLAEAYKLVLRDNGRAPAEPQGGERKPEARPEEDKPDIRP